MFEARSSVELRRDVAQEEISTYRPQHVTQRIAGRFMHKAQLGLESDSLAAGVLRERRTSSAK